MLHERIERSLDQRARYRFIEAAGDDSDTPDAIAVSCNRPMATGTG